MAKARLAPVESGALGCDGVGINLYWVKTGEWLRQKQEAEETNFQILTLD
ncbi:MAG: hypothetical protein R3F11_11405 [Verrucomicrobiales bacterium]